MTEKQTFLAIIYGAMSLVCFVAIWGACGVLVAWIFGAVACGAPAVLLPEVGGVKKD